MDEGEKAEVARNYSQALSLYREAVSLHSLPDYRLKVTQMQNLVEAERDPVAFTQRIINEYRGGILNTRIQNRIAELTKKYKRNQIRDSGWKILVTGSQQRYEARFDIIAPQETFFYVWSVNLKDRSLTALNKLSEEAMK
jgi:ABC-type branched-subunit amino acid transport system substrate-binding protein